MTELSAKKFLDLKSAVLTTTISLNSYGEQKFYISFYLRGIIGFCLETYPGRELKNMTILKIKSKELPLSQTAEAPCSSSFITDSLHTDAMSSCEDANLLKLEPLCLRSYKSLPNDARVSFLNREGFWLQRTSNRIAKLWWDGIIVIALSLSTKSRSAWPSKPGGRGCREPWISSEAFLSRDSLCSFYFLRTLESSVSSRMLSYFLWFIFELWRHTLTSIGDLRTSYIIDKMSLTHHNEMIVRSSQPLTSALIIDYQMDMKGASLGSRSMQQ